MREDLRPPHREAACDLRIEDLFRRDRGDPAEFGVRDREQGVLAVDLEVAVEHVVRGHRPHRVEAPVAVAHFTVGSEEHTGLEVDAREVLVGLIVVDGEVHIRVLRDLPHAVVLWTVRCQRRTLRPLRERLRRGRPAERILRQHDQPYVRSCHRLGGDRLGVNPVDRRSDGAAGRFGVRAVVDRVARRLQGERAKACRHISALASSSRSA